MNGLTCFGLLAVTAMMLFYAAEHRAPIYILGFAVACMMGSIYGFLQGAWPFGIVECIGAVDQNRRRARLPMASKPKTISRPSGGRSSGLSPEEQ